ncbi:MAG: DinB family protein [Pseudomonadota bacterium]
MISVDYVQVMARYNAWQNNGLIELLQGVDAEALNKDRGAFFGSILGTLNHILWGDRIWMARFDDWTKPTLGIAESPTLCPTFDAWSADRVRADGRIKVWADKLSPVRLRGDLTWMSGATGREMAKPIAICVTHFFNHQTHHRGQVHAMLTSAGLKPQMTDLALAPADALV